MEPDRSIANPPADADVAALFRTAEERGADGAAAFFSNGFRALVESRFRSPKPEEEQVSFVAALLEGLARCPFRDRLAAEPSFSDFLAWLEVPSPPPPDILAGFVQTLSRVFGPSVAPATPKPPLAAFRRSFSRPDRVLQRLGAALGVARGLSSVGIRHPLEALRLARDLAAAARSGLFDRDFYAWEHPDVPARRFASPLLHYCAGGWRKGWAFAPDVPPIPPDLLPPRENPLLLHARIFPGRKPTADTLRILWRRLRPDLWKETVRGRLRAEAAHPEIAVVVPVYNHPELLPPLVASLLEHTPPDVLLLFVENGSGDPRVRPALLRLAAENPGRVQVECLDENAGFAGACNHGMRAAGRRDVVLLNNDTVVGPRWTDSLRLAAYADERIGSATAVSDNSGIVSVPNRGKNDLPPGRSVATVARGWLHVPETVFGFHTGHGFCLYLKRAMLDDAGVFDAGAFGKGYGEETDLCLRARAKGWRHRITTRAFVWHLNAVSFGGLYKAFKIHVARHALVARHPELESLEAENIPRWGGYSPTLRSLDAAVRNDAPRPRVLLLATAGNEGPFPEPFAAALRRSFDVLAFERKADGSAALRGSDPGGTVLESGAGSDDDLVAWTIEHGVELVLAADPALAGPALRARFAALHVPVLDGPGPEIPGESPERAAARLGARLAAALSFAPDGASGTPFAAEKTRDLVLPPEPVPGASDPAAFDRTDLSDVRELVVDGLPLPVSDDARLLLLARLCGTRIRIRAKTEEPRFWIDRATPHFRLLAAADAIEKPNRPPLDEGFLPLFPKPPPPPPPEVLAERVADYLRAKAARAAPARHVVYTAIAGGYESLKIPDEPDPDVDYVYFAPEPAGNEGPWTYRPFAWTDEDPTRTARWHKLHAPDLFPDAETVVWIDGNVTPLPGTERGIRETLLAGPNPIATLRHFDRDNVWDEAEACVERGKDDPAILRAQAARYRAAGLPEKHPFAETCIVASRPRDPRARAVFATWWEELAAGSRRDQISLPFALWKNGAGFTPLFDRDIRLAVDKVRFAGHARRNLPKTNAEVPKNS